MKNMNMMTFLALALLISACAQPQGNDRLQEKADIEAGSGQNAIDKKAQEMERGLTRQQRFFRGVAGTYEGTYKSKDGTLFNTSFILTPTIPVYTGERIRNVDEITYDLTNLAFNVEQRTWTKHSDGTEVSFGHNYDKIKPLTDSGYIYVGDDYPVSFVVSALGTLNQVIVDPLTLDLMRRQVAKDLLDGTGEGVEYLQVELRSTNMSHTITFLAKRRK